MALDCTMFPKTALTKMLQQEAFKEHHEAIKAFLAPKPKDMTPVEGKVQWRAKNSTMSTTSYPRGYIRLELNQGAGCLYKGAAIELRDHLNALIEGGSLKDYGVI